MTENVTANEQKKKHLKEYGTHVRQIRRIEAEISELRAMKMYPSRNNDGMPKSRKGQNDLSGYAAKLDELERELGKERHQRIKGYEEIVSQVKRLRSEKEKDVLFYRYIKELDWWEIAEKMCYTERWIFKLHDKALSHLELS